MNQVADLCPISDQEAALAVSPATDAELTQRVTAMPGERTVRPRPRMRSWRLAAPLAGVAAAAAVAAAIAVSGTSVGPISVAPATAQALTFTSEGRYILVIVRDPMADLRRYRAELAARHLNITLRLVPASPSLVGTLVEGSGPSDITPITARGRCWTGGGGNACPVGLKIPANFRGSADYTFGRAARPGEQYETSAPATAPGEVMHGLQFRGRTVATLLNMLRERHVTVPQYRRLQTSANTTYSNALRPDQVPGNWYVQDAIPWAQGQVLLFVGPHPHTR
jgi:hypothetical protein